MALRDLPFAHLTTVFVLGGLDDHVLRAIPAALEAMAGDRRAVRTAWPGGLVVPRRLSRDRARAAARRSVHRAADEGSDADLADAANDRGFSGIPVSVTLTPTRCAVAMAHGVFDGSGSVRLIEDLLAVAAGRTLAEEPRPERGAVLRAALDLRGGDLRSFWSARVSNHGLAVGTAMARAPRTPARRSVSTAIGLDEADRAAIRRLPSQGGRATLSSRICALAVTTLRDLRTDPGDIAVSVPSELRHLVHGSVDGNFVSVNLLGTLLEGDWDPGAVALRISRGQDRSELLSVLTSWPRAVARAARSRRTGSEYGVSVSILSTRHPGAELAAMRSVTVAAFGRWPSTTLAFVWHVGANTHVSVWDETGQFDLSRFDAEFHRSLARGSAASS